jgi:hypothetical protein
MPLRGAPTCVSGPSGAAITTEEYMMSTICIPLHHKIGGAFGALALMVVTLAMVASLASPTASAMKAECYAHVQAGRWAEAHGMYDVASMEHAAANACDDGY